MMIMMMMVMMMMITLIISFTIIIMIVIIIKYAYFHKFQNERFSFHSFICLRGIVDERSIGIQGRNIHVKRTDRRFYEYILFHHLIYASDFKDRLTCQLS